jgi:aryl-alcohol dehydrogenase-like predicted oxidoreductase
MSVPTIPFQDIAVNVPGFGAMSMSGSYGTADDSESMQVLERALELGNTFWDTAVVYGNGHNESLIGRFLKEHPGSREKVFIGSKCGFDVSRFRPSGTVNITEIRSIVMVSIMESLTRAPTSSKVSKEL